jgi:hypothetical protein
VIRTIRSHIAPAIAALSVALLLAGTSLAWCSSSVAAAAASTASEAPVTTNDSFLPDLGVPATDVVAFGVSPGESPNAAWAYGKLNGSEAYTLFEHLDSGAWRALPLTPEGASLGAIELGPLGAQATFAGGVVAVAEAGIAVRNPGGTLQLVPAPEAMQSEAGEATKSKSEGGGSGQAGSSQAGSGEAKTPAAGSPGATPEPNTESPQANSDSPQGVLGSGESIPPSAAPADASTPYAAIEEANGATGILIAPYNDGSGAPAPGILHYNGSHWLREPITIPSPSSSTPAELKLTPKALACGGTSTDTGASSPENCWLLAAYESEGAGGQLNRLALFRRTASSDPSGYTWQQVRIADPSGLLGTPAGGSGQSTTTSLDARAQMLSATSSGLWIDFQGKVGEAESQVSELVIPTTSLTPGPTARAVGTWCFHPSSGATGAACNQTIEQALPGQYRSFAWPGPTPEAPGTRIITGYPSRGMLELNEDSFSYVTNVPAGSQEGTVPGAAAFSSPRQGWIADGVDESTALNKLVEGADGAGQSQVIEVTTNPSGDQLHEESVPFRHPLLALAQAPGTALGDPGAEAIAVGAEGEIGRYEPSKGWRPEALYDAAGKAQTPTLRGVAWPEPSRIYAVGDNGTMWLWRAETGLWEPDPAKPFNFIGNLTAIAFAPGNPALGYAVGKQGVLLKYGKSWEAISALESKHLEAELQVEEQDLDFTSITFAGNEALATYRMVSGEGEVGGVIVDEGGSVEEGGSGWHAEVNIPKAGAGVLSKIAGLPDGGVVAAGPEEVIERDGPGKAWRFSSEPPPLTQNVSALAAYREAAGPVRAIISVDLNRDLDPNNVQQFRFSSWGMLDDPPSTGPGQPPFFVEPDPLPATGYVLKETADGWIDIEHAALPAIEGELVDQPQRPDPVLALLVDPAGNTGLAVGGQTGDFEATPAVGGLNIFDQTGAAMRFPAAAASANGSVPAPVASPPGQASFVVAGQAACMQACFANENIGPEVWLSHALASANQINQSPAGLRAFLYTGSSGGTDALTSKLSEYDEPLPIAAAGAPSTCPPGEPHYCHFVSNPPPAPTGYPASYTGGRVMVIMLSYAGGVLEAGEEAKLEEWLGQAHGESIPAIVVGNDALGFKLPNNQPIFSQEIQEAQDAAAVSSILINGQASAYFFDYPGNNVRTVVPGSEIPAYGSGTIGYASPPIYKLADLLGSSGFLMASVNTAESARGWCPPGTADCTAKPVTARIIPNIGQLSMNATEGLLLRRSHVALFEALARRPQSGIAILDTSFQNRTLIAPDPYDQIPFDCQGENCQYQVPTEYTFTSSEPDKGAFVAHEPGSVEPDKVEIGPNKLPVIDEPRNSRGELNPGNRFSENSNHEPVNEKGEVVPADQSGLFCAFNATPEKSVTVSISTGGLTYSEPVTIQAGSVEYPCGTVPLKNPPPAESTQLAALPSVPLASANPPQTNPQIETIAPPPPPAAPAVLPPHPARPHPPTSVPFLPLVAPSVTALPAIVPPPGPPVPRPIPPSGTSPVYQSAVAPEDQREEETATSLVGLHEFSAYRADEHSGPGPWLLLLVLVAAGAGTGIYRGTRSSQRRRAAFARAETRRTPWQ